MGSLPLEFLQEWSPPGVVDRGAVVHMVEMLMVAHWEMLCAYRCPVPISQNVR